MGHEIRHCVSACDGDALSLVAETRHSRLCGLDSLGADPECRVELEVPRYES